MTTIVAQAILALNDKQKRRIWAVALVGGFFMVLTTMFSRKQGQTAHPNLIWMNDQTNVVLGEPTDLVMNYNNEENLNNFQMKNGKPLAEAIADEHLERVLKRIGDERGPFIAGGIGDSGTRGMWDVMMKFGVYMQGKLNVRGDSRDSLKFMSQRPTIQSDGSVLLRSPSALYNEPIMRARSIKYNRSHVRSDRWQCGRQFIADTLDEIINDTIAERIDKGKKYKLHPFGFKHPRTALLLPYFLATLGDKFAFVHVIRDGREVASGDNNYLFMDHCMPYYGVKCSENKAMEMWADLNQEVFEFALESGMKANQYFAIRIEDLVQGKRKCFDNLAKFLELPNDMGINMTERMESAIQNSMAHSKSYFGQKYKYFERQDMLAAPNKKTREALKFWGYSDAKFELDLECTDLPWIAKFREKKGKLPIDS